MRTPCFCEVPYGQADAVFAQVSHLPFAQFLDSADASHAFENTNRYSYIVFNPIQVLQNEGDIFAALTCALAPHAHHAIAHLPPFQGGALGLLSYDTSRSLERLPDHTQDDQHVPDHAIGIYDAVISFDHHHKRAYVVAQDQAKVDAVRNEVDFAATCTVPAGQHSADWNSDVNQAAYEAMVDGLRHAIRSGDVFEINVSQRFAAPRPNDWKPFAFYQRLRARNSAPFAAFLNLGSHIIASVSPERFVEVRAGKVQTRPIKGTMARGQTPEQDLVNANALMRSEKDRAENTMIVDLMRNDLSKVCTDDSVHVDKWCGLESHPDVHHLVSVINAELREGETAVSLLKACFPGGSITGAPKVRAMELIEQFETHRRGAYCGSIVWVSFAGDMDSSIVIRTVVADEQTLTCHAGGAIVLESDPMAEYHETLLKAKALTEVRL
jgi:para-aminobenzoate synthetase component 1